MKRLLLATLILSLCVKSMAAPIDDMEQAAATAADCRCDAIFEQYEYNNEWYLAGWARFEARQVAPSVTDPAILAAGDLKITEGDAKLTDAASLYGDGIDRLATADVMYDEANSLASQYYFTYATAKYYASIVEYAGAKT
ncbi:MAG TPA: hypothetical protein VMX74_13195, partial [Pirellulales bacterium]|nr:hypothetical protein [Pirellulales bacterium]